jgi:DNA polymerase I-like protein with 3'-5' exonuclease and polymerase domains
VQIPAVTVIDFETLPILARPDYPPKPVGFSVQLPTEKRSRYYAFGHVTGGNNCSAADARRVLREAWHSGPLLFQNGKFDVDVAEAHMGIKSHVSALDIHDTLFLLFLSDPHATNLSLKPSAERILGLKPTEQQNVGRWLVEHQRQLKVDGLLPANEPGITMHNFGKWICLAPGNLVGTYADGDILRTLKLFRKLYPEIVTRGMLPAYQREQRLMPILLQNEREGMHIDLRLLEKNIVAYEAEQVKAEAWLRKTLKAPSLNFDSDAQLADALEATGIVTEFALTKTGKRSVGKATLKAQHFSKPQVHSVLMYRNKLTTCLGTFMHPWLDVARRTDGVVHTSWNQVRQSHGAGTGGARTGRLSSSPNFQNIPKKLEGQLDGFQHPTCIELLRLPQLRKLILPDSKDQWFGRRDYNQQELRILAHFENGALLRAYLENPDLDTHGFVQQVVSQLLDKHVERTPVKTLNFGYIFGQGVASMAEKLELPVAGVKRLRDAQLRALPGLKDLQQGLKARAAQQLPIRTWGGREYYCEHPAYSQKFGKIMSFEYKLLSHLVQGSAGDCTKEAIIRYHEMPGREGRIIVTVHDEIDISAPKGCFRTEMLRLREAMESVEFDLQMKSDAEYGPNWGTLKDLNEKHR